jgi:hypothetical protein
LLALYTSIRLVWKGLQGTNTLSYYNCKLSCSIKPSRQQNNMQFFFLIFFLKENQENDQN